MPTKIIFEEVLTEIPVPEKITLEKPKVLYLDLSVWRCGKDDENKPFSLGNGTTQLINENSEMCCLGQFNRQLGISSSSIQSLASPADIDNMLSFLVDEENNNTLFSEDCIEINDDRETTIREKVEKLTDACKNEGIELRVIDTEKILARPTTN